MSTTSKEKKETPAEESLGKKYVAAIGRRKTSSAQVRLYQDGSGIFLVNNKKLEEYFPENISTIATQPLKLTSSLKDFNISVLVDGGGVKAQAEAIRHGIARVLSLLEEDLAVKMKVKGWMTRDARKKERKKPGLKKARRAPQWSKR